MKSLFLPLHMTGIGVSGVEMVPDENRLVSVPESAVEDLLAAGLMDPDDEEKMSAYLETLSQDPEPAPKKAAPVKAAAKKPSVRH